MTYEGIKELLQNIDVNQKTIILYYGENQGGKRGKEKQRQQSTQNFGLIDNTVPSGLSDNKNIAKFYIHF